uniref:Nicotinate phosphoribosyltransferase n=1 Tax=Anopheles coluzzii TaxID=1518534 RepID=A0A6E8VX35_ANOCL|nr:nicotinate phosphoribosyltransferase isoform X1 [Anopheles coluzzii]XP_049466569.1 nicotinate phosphoribosyltransferase isoform X1 [Anopheles coluzzii]XP_049466570.1 nicotinate phosphoribosyltransferase isoform X1 [Anopheles coluzzii]XP_049466571.1 nicotinate phosphoribosyltransferase isoform X1 [Anopheles coluzzii]XP_049466572.1 nicotinate phosphoribosyltransferase isoform X1 [Anopheles coluzzii]
MSSLNRELSTDSAFAAGRNSWNRHYHNSVVQPLLTDLYQITMAYAYWKSGKIDDHAVFDLFFRTNPFQGEFTIFAGLEECLKFLDSFHYSETDIEYLKHALPQGIEDEFFEYLSQLTAKDVTLYAIEEGSVAFPRVPLIKVAGPLIIVQLLETTLLTLVNYASLMATNAARYRMVAGKHIHLLEFGLRRAQGPDGGLSASKYSYIGGFDGTSNVLAGKLFNIPVKGTHAHAYITSFTGIDELKTRVLQHKEDGTTRDLLELAMEHRAAIASVLDVSTDESSEGELAAMVSFAIAFPDGFMALVDTYDVKSDKALGEPTEELSDPPDSVVCDSLCAGRLLDQDADAGSLLPVGCTALPEIPEEECNGCCAEEHGETLCTLHDDVDGEPSSAGDEQEQQAEEEATEPAAAEESCPPPSITVEDEDEVPVGEGEPGKGGSDENGNEDIEDQNVRNATEQEQEEQGEDDESHENQVDVPEEEIEEQKEEDDGGGDGGGGGGGEDEIIRCANCEALNTMIHHLKSVGKSFSRTCWLERSLAEFSRVAAHHIELLSYYDLTRHHHFLSRSGLLNFCAVALGLNDQGYRAIGIRIDSGDLAYLSCLARETFERIAERFKLPWFSKLTIVASNDINEDTILSLNEQGHKIDCFGIGTHLVTCQRQPALGCVYKMVEINNQPRIKLSQDVGKVTMPGSKNVFRLYGADGHALIDLLQRVDENPPEVGQKVLCRHPFQESKRAYVIPTQVEPLYRVYWAEGRVAQVLPSLEEVRERVQASLRTLRQDHKRTLNPTPYKVAVSDNLYNFIHELWLQNAPIGELS